MLEEFGWNYLRKIYFFLNFLRYLTSLKEEEKSNFKNIIKQNFMKNSFRLDNSTFEFAWKFCFDSNIKLDFKSTDKALNSEELKENNKLNNIDNDEILIKSKY